MRAKPDKRLGDLFAQRQLAGCAEALDHIVIDRDRLVAAAERPERARLVEERPGDLFAQRQLGCRAKPGQQIVIDGNLVRDVAERPEPKPLVDERPGDLFAGAQLSLLLSELASFSRNTMGVADASDDTFLLYPQMTALQARAFELLGVSARP